MTVRFSYHVDPEDQGRVVTIARKVEGNNVLFGFSVCQPTRWATFEGTDTVYKEKIKGDHFNKKDGRDMAVGRMNKRPFIVYRTEEDTRHPLDVVRATFAAGFVSMKDKETGKQRPVPDFILRTVLHGKNPSVAYAPEPRKSVMDGQVRVIAKIANG